MAARRMTIITRCRAAATRHQPASKCRHGHPLLSLRFRHLLPPSRTAIWEATLQRSIAQVRRSDSAGSARHQLLIGRCIAPRRPARPLRLLPPAPSAASDCTRVTALGLPRLPARRHSPSLPKTVVPRRIRRNDLRAITLPTRIRQHRWSPTRSSWVSCCS